MQLSIQQQEAMSEVVDSIIDNLDEYALRDLFSGSQADVDGLFKDIYDMTETVLYGYSGESKDLKSLNLDRFTASVNETLRCSNFNYFVTDTLPTFDMGLHHLEWGNFAQMYQKLCILAARDHSKSYVFSFAYILWQLYRYKKGMPGEKIPGDIRLAREGMLITNEYGLGINHLGKVKEEIENNDIFREKLMPKNRESWGKESLKCQNEAKVYVKSYGSRMRGFHPTWAVIDDFLDESNLYSEDQRQKYINYFFSVVTNAVVPKGPIRVIGTPFASTDLYGKLKTTPGWRVFEYPALFPDGRVLYPERYDLKAVLEKRESLGNIIFSREILVKPVVSESTIFPYETVSKCFDPTLKMVNNIASFPKKMEKIAIGCDFARSANIGADFTVFTVLGQDIHGTYYVLHINRFKGKTYNEQLAVLKRLNNSFYPDIIVMEDNQMQTLFVDGAREMNLPVEGMTTGTNKYDLRTGVPGMSIVFEQQKMVLPTGDEGSLNATEMLSGELASITWTEKGLQGVGAHDDMPMSLWKAIKGIRKTNRNLTVGFL